MAECSMGVKGIIRPPEFSITGRKYTLFLEFNCRQRPSKKGWPIKAFWSIAAGKGRLPFCGIAGHSHWAAIPPDDVLLDLHNSCRPWKSKKSVCL